MAEIEKAKHDEFFKTNLQCKKIAEAYIQQHLASEIVKLCDFSTLKNENTEFIDAELKKSLVDVLYSINIDHKKSYIYFICEAESTDKNELLAFKMLNYSMKVMQQHLKQNKKKLPLVLPIVLYHGKKSPYPHSLDIYDCFEEPELAKIYAFNFKLIDLTIIDAETLAHQDFKLFFEVILKYGRDEKIFSELIKIIRQQPHLNQYFIFAGEDLMRAFQNYLLSLNIDAKTVKNEILLELDQLIGGDFMNLGQQFEERGVQKGMQQGMVVAEQWKEQGISQGMQQNAKTVAKNLLKKGMKISDIAEITGLTEKIILEIQKSDKL